MRPTGRFRHPRFHSHWAGIQRGDRQQETLRDDFGSNQGSLVLRDQLRFSDLDSEVLSFSRRCVPDGLAVALAGSEPPGMAPLAAYPGAHRNPIDSAIEAMGWDRIRSKIEI